jgi:hypothetical protein
LAAIHRATFGPLHNLPSGGASSSVAANSATSSLLNNGRPPRLRRRRSPSAAGPSPLYRAASFCTRRPQHPLDTAPSATLGPQARSQMV